MWPNSWQKTLMSHIFGAAFLDDEVGPAFALMGEVRPVRPIEAAAVGLHAFAGIEEEDAVEVLQAILAVTGMELVEGFGEQARSWRCRLPGRSHCASC